MPTTVPAATPFGWLLPPLVGDDHRVRHRARRLRPRSARRRPWTSRAASRSRGALRHPSSPSRTGVPVSATCLRRRGTTKTDLQDLIITHKVQVAGDTANKAYAALTVDAQGYLVARYGVDVDTAAAASQIVDVPGDRGISGQAADRAQLAAQGEGHGHAA